MKLLKFYTPQCRHCPSVTQFLETQGVEHESINLFEHPEKSLGYKVLGIPTLILVNDEGREITRNVGGVIPQVKDFLESHGLIKKGE